MFLTSLIFASQDGLSKHLAQEANPVFVVMIRYWAFMAFATILSARRPGGISAAIRSRALRLQVLRGGLLAGEIVVTVAAFTLLGLAETHAIFAVCPLIIVALSGPVLGEEVGWRRWCAVGAGFTGMLVILRPGTGVFAWEALTALTGSALFAAYGLLTRLAARHDPASTSFFWTGVAGGAFMTVFGPFWWDSLAARDWLLMGLLCITGATGHYLLIRAYEAAEAAVLQPFAYLQLVFASLIGVLVFGEKVDAWTVAGAAIVVSAGLYSFKPVAQ